MINNRSIKSLSKNTVTKRYVVTLLCLFLLAPVAWVVALAVDSTFEQVTDVKFFTKVINTTENKEVVRVRVKNKSADIITGSFRLVVTNTDLPVKNATGITGDGEPYYLFKKGKIISVLPGKSIRLRISNVLFDEADDDDEDNDDELSESDFRLERRIVPEFNSQPVSNAGIDQYRQKGDVVYLDGSRSFDKDGDRLTFNWVLEKKPSRSTTVLVNPHSVNPHFNLDRKGRYVFALYVNDGTENSLYDRVRVKTRNVRPVAHAGSNQLAVSGDTVQLDGSASYDANGDAITYKWVLETFPEGSGATLDNVTSVQPKLTIDRTGQYIVKLKVNDGKSKSFPDRVVIADSGLQPIANAGVDQLAAVNTLVQLDASGSYAFDAQPLSYHWSLVTAPAESVSTLSDALALTPTLQIDQPGEYIIQLVVNDGVSNSLVDQMIVSTNNVRPIADAGEAQTVLLNSLVQLNAANSSDADGDLLTYRWSMLHKPDTSTASLANVTNILTDFVADVSGQYVMQLVVSDDQLDSYADTVVITADTEINTPPVIQSSPVLTVLVDTLYSYTVTATDDNGATLTYALTQSPTGMTIDPNGGLIAWTPDTAGSYAVNISVSDGQGGEDTQQFEVVVEQPNQSPVIESLPVLTAKTDTLYSYTVVATDVDGDTLSYSLIQSPSGMIIDANSGLITWTPGVAGTYTVNVLANDGQGGEDSQQFDIVVEELNQAPVIQSDPVITGETEALYSYSVVANDANGDTLNYVLTQSPTGMVISTTGLITWTPSVTGTYPVTVQVNDGKGGTDEQLFVITITQANSAPTITSTPNAQATIDQAYTYQVLASDADSDVLTYRLLTAPLGMNINAATGIINWLPLNFETANVNVEVDDSKGGKVTQQFSVSAAYPASNQPPTFAPLADVVVTIGTKFTLQLNAQDPEGETITYAISPLPMPGNATLNSQTGVLIFKPQVDQAGVYNFVISASDQRFSTKQTFKITVPPLDPTLPTSFHGRVIDANSASQDVELPIVGATISFLETGVSTVTDAQGYFTLNNLPVTAKVFSIDGSTANLAPGGASYASFRELLSLIEHANNVEERPFYMPRNNMASMTQVDPNQTTMVENEELGVTLEIPPNTAMNDDGTPFIGQISISAVPDGLEPASMPPNFNPGLLITIQPAGVRFTTPVPITFPNTDNLPPGTEYSIMSVDPDTGVFVPVGTAVVGADGKSIVTTSGGIVEADWHFPSTQAVDEVTITSGDNQGTNGCDTGSTTCLKDGRMSQSVSLPEYRSLETDRAVSLTYQTSRAGQAVQALQNLGSSSFNNRQRIRIKITYKLVNASPGGFANGPPPEPDYTKITTTIAGIEGRETVLGVPPNNQDNVFTGVSLETEGLGTGMYTATTTVVVKVGFSISGVTNSTEMMIIDESASPFGSGWMIENVDRLHFHATTGTALLVSADGRYKIYKFNKSSQTYTTPAGDFSTLVKNAGSTYTLTDQFGNQSFFNSLGLQTESQDLNGNSTLFAYNGDNELVSITDPVGKQTIFSYSNDRVASITDPANRITQFEHDGLGNLTRIIYPDTSEMKYEYVGHLMIKKTDERNNVTQYHYDEEGFNTHVTLPDSSQRGVRSALSKGFGVASSTINNPLDSFFDASSGTYFNARGNISEFELDGRSFTTKEVDSLGRITLYDRDTNSRPLTTTRPNGSVVTKTFDTLGNTTSEREDFNGALYQYTYDSHSLITSITNPNNHSVTVTRDVNGNPVEIVNELGHTTTIDFNSSGLPTRIVTPNNLEIVRIYNVEGLLETQIETPAVGSPGNVRTSNYQYFDSGLLKQVDTADGRIYTYTYDQRSRLLSITDNLGQKQTALYDGYGNIIGVDTSNADGSDALHVEYGYDSRNRLTEMRLPHQATDAITRLLLDGEDNVTELIDPKGSQRKMHYDKVDRLDENIHRLGGVSKYSYDLNDQMTKVIAPNGATTNYSYDLLGRRLSESSPDRGYIQYQYDLADNLTQQIDARGVVTDYIYDELERLTSKIFPSSPLEDVTLQYDVCALGVGRLCQIADETGVSNYQYDAWGNITQQQKTELGQTYTTAYQYDEGDNISQILYPSGRIISITRDGVRRMQSVQTTLNQSGSTINKTLMANTLYRADDQITQCSFGNGLTESRGYDLQGRLTSQQTTNGAGIVDQRVYDYDINSNLIDRSGSAQTSHYRYDLLDRLTQDAPTATSNLAARESNLQYDQNHNRQRKTSYLPDLATAQSTQTKAYNYSGLGNRLLSEETLSQNLPIVADNENEQLQYNAANRLSNRIVKDGLGNLIKATDYLYNAQGQRTRKVRHNTDGTSTTTLYHYNLDGQLITETNESGNNIRDYVWHNLSPVAQIEHDQAAANDAIYYLHVDHLFTPRFATNTTKQLIWRWEGEAFGETKAEENVDGDAVAITVNLRFPGQYFDEESGTHYNYFRTYDPSLGRYTESDPIGLSGGINTFGYAGANPIIYIDPDGKCFQAIGIGLAVAAAVLAASKVKDMIDNLSNKMDAIQDSHENIDALGDGKGDIKNDALQVQRDAISSARDAAVQAGKGGLPGTLSGGPIPKTKLGAAVSGVNKSARTITQ